MAELPRIRSMTVLSVSCSVFGKSRWRSLRIPGLDPLDPQHLAEHEQHQQHEREHRQHQVVGDHRREPGDVLRVSALPEGAQPGGVALDALRRGRGARATLSAPSRVGRRAMRARRRRGGGAARSRSATSQCLSDLARRPPGQLQADGGGAAGEAEPGAGEILEPRRRGAGVAAVGADAGACPAAFAPVADARAAARRGLSTPGRVFGRLPSSPLSSLMQGHRNNRPRWCWCHGDRFVARLFADFRVSVVRTRHFSVLTVETEASNIRTDV